MAGLSATNDSPTTLGQATHLTATVTAGTNVTYSWDFGDGSAELTTGYTTGSGATPAHTYSGAGAYTAIVTASNSANALTAVPATTPVTVTDLPVAGLAQAADGSKILTRRIIVHVI